MTIKEQVLLILEENKGVPVSGEELAKRLGCSRTGVWKAIKALTDEGYEVEAVNKKGYTLKISGDVISKAFIVDMVRAAGVDIEIEVKHSVDSTNNVLKGYANSGFTGDIVLLAEEQTAGRGRMGRSFLSPDGTGIYMSFLLHPSVPISEASGLTTLAVTAEAKAIEKVTGENVDIKWVNDVWMRGKKVSGILTEGSASMEDGSTEYVVVGIGFNIYEPNGGFAPEIRDVAGAIISDGVRRENLKNKIAAEFIVEFMNYYKDFPKRTYIDEYRKRCFVIGRDVEIVGSDHEPLNMAEKDAPDRTHAYVTGVDDACHLLVRYPDGTEGMLSSGEISIRL